MVRIAVRAIAPVAAVLVLATVVRAADPQDYTFVSPVTGDLAVDTALRDASLLIGLREKNPAPPFALIDRARGDDTRFRTVMEGFGYYKAAIQTTIAGRDLADETLPDLLDKVPQKEAVEIKTVIQPGPQFTLRHITVEGQIPDSIDADIVMNLHSGDPAIASQALGAQAALLSALQEKGYAFAKVATPVAFADDDANVLDVSFAADPGAETKIGRISFTGLERVDETYVRENLEVRSGDLYKPSAIEAARLKLVGLGVFSGVSVAAQPEAGTDSTLPLEFDVQERARHAVSLSGNYSTDLGLSLSARWSHRNLLGRGEQLNLSASGIGLGGTATAGLGYNLGVQFIKPRFLRGDQEFEVNLGAIKQQLDAYDQTAETFSVFARKHFSALWSGTGGFSFIHDEVSQEGTDKTYDLVSLPVTAVYDSTGLNDPLADPVNGERVTLSVAPTAGFGDKTLLFAVLQASGSIYFDLSGDGRSVLAVRALAGSIQGASSFDLPPDQRLYAGGSGTVRGFRYQSIGPHFASGNPAGAVSFDAMSLEIRQRVYGDYGVAAFVDAGQAGTASLPFSGDIEVGAGVGLRYYTAIGAIRADVAVPLTNVPGGDSFAIYISIGQAF